MAPKKASSKAKKSTGKLRDLDSLDSKVKNVKGGVGRKKRTRN
jgi:hypothetical protein